MNIEVAKNVMRSFPLVCIPLGERFSEEWGNEYKETSLLGAWVRGMCIALKLDFEEFKRGSGRVPDSIDDRGFNPIHLSGETANED